MRRLQELSEAGETTQLARAMAQTLADSLRQLPWLRDRARYLASALAVFETDLIRAAEVERAAAQIAAAVRETKRAAG